MKRLIYIWRCCLCECFISWSLKVSPKDYVPSSVQATINAIEGASRNADDGPMPLDGHWTT
jgi:hypothetical protein